MVFQAIKNLFSPSTSHTLYKNTKKLVTSTLSIKPHFITLSHISISINRIHNLSHNPTELTFTYQNDKYTLKGPNLQSIHDQLVTLIKPKTLVFKASNVRYLRESRLVIENAEVCIFKEDNFFYLIVIVQEGDVKGEAVKGEVVHEEQITDANRYSVEPGQCAFVWTLVNNNVGVTYRIEFEKQVEYLEYLSKYTKCIMRHEFDEQSQNKNYYNEHKLNDQNNNTYKNNSIDNQKNRYDPENDQMSNYSPRSVNVSDSAQSYKQKTIVGYKEPENAILSSTTENNYNPTDKLDINSAFSTLHDTDADQSYLFDTSSDEDDTRNKNLTVSNQNKAFVTRGSSIGIFDLDNEHLDFQSTVNLNIDPKKILHHNNSLIIMDENTNNKLYNVDLQRGSITDEWDINRSITDYFDSHKTQSGDIIGINDTSLFKMDLRTPKKIVSENNYKTKTNFTCGMSSKEGDLVIANKKGDLRLYNNLEKRAKKLLHGLGDEIYGLDSTADGRYVVCTTSTYLLFYDLCAPDIVPKRLQLRHDHLAYMDKIQFTPAKFNKSNDCLVTSSGRFVITWNVSDVDQNVYSIRKCKDVVVADGFTSGENIVVAMPNDVRIVNKKKMKNTNKVMRE